MSTETSTQTFTTCDTRTLVRQIGTMNVLAISGGRVNHHRTGVILPVAHGYRVCVDLAADDTYTVRRILVRGAKMWTKSETAGVYASEVGEVAYRASLSD